MGEMRTDGPRKNSVLLDKLAYKCPTLYLEMAVKHTMNFILYCSNE